MPDYGLDCQKRFTPEIRLKVIRKMTEQESESDEYVKDTNTGFYLTAGECAI